MSLCPPSLQVDFDDFKDSFVWILCQTNMDEPLSDEPLSSFIAG